MENNSDVTGSGENPFYHYLTTGIVEGRRPVPLPTAFRNEQQLELVRRTLVPEFNGEFYTQHYPEHKIEILDPLEHFLLLGYARDYDPAPWFSVADYLAANPDVRQGGINPFYHYLVLGRMEGRALIPDAAGAVPAQPDTVQKSLVESEFDAAYYLQQNPDVRAAGIAPLDHYMNSGWREGRDPSPDFSTSYYLQANPDVRAVGINPFFHYLHTGRQEGRAPVLPGGYIAQALYNLRSLEGELEEWYSRELPGLQSGAADSLSQRLAGCLADGAARLVVSLGHDDYRSIAGGVQNCIRLEQHAVQDCNAIYLNLNPALPLPVLSSELNPEKLLLYIICNGEHLGMVSAQDCLTVLQGLPQPRCRVDLVVHALLGFSAEFVTQLAQSVVNGSCLYWLHDYQTLCPGYNLLRNTVRYCGIPAADSMACAICIYGEERQAQLPRMQKLFSALDFTVLAPSQSAAELWRGNTSLQYRELHVQPHTRFIDHADPPSPATKPEDGMLRIAFLGFPRLHKGWPVFMRLVQACRHNPALEFHVLGEEEHGLPAGVHYTPVRVSEWDPAAMQMAMSRLDIDIAFVWSIWPETYCITAHEAVAAGVTVVTNAQSGHVVEMVRELDCGLVFRDEEEMLGAFKSGLIRQLLTALRARGQVRPRLLEYSAMSQDSLGLVKK
ncbi:MAG: hypothetical protein R3F42_06715 [Pseudomonadota bacterium]